MKLSIRRVRHNLTDPIVVTSHEWALSLFGHCEEYDDQSIEPPETAIMVEHRERFSVVGRLPGCRYRYATPALEIILST